jgi:ribosomal protein S18 acetylase RimI-like enzyme
MLEAKIRLATDQDGAHLLKAVTDEQDYERALHDIRRPGADIAGSYLAHTKPKIAQNQGALLVAEVNGVFAGYAACWIEHDGNIAETDDSNHFGYVADTYVVPEFRGRGVVSRMLETAESHMRVDW